MEKIKLTKGKDVKLVDGKERIELLLENGWKKEVKERKKRTPKGE